MKRHLGRFFSHGRNWLAFLLVLAFAFAALFPSLLSPNNPVRPGPFQVVGKSSAVEPQPPSASAPLGTLPSQYSVYHALIWGSRDAMRFGLVAALSVAIIGILYGAVAGYAGGVVNRTMMRVADAFLTIPIIAAVVLLQQLLLNTINTIGGTDLVFWSGQQGIQVAPQFYIQYLLQHVNPLTLSLILFSWMPYARLVNTLVIELKQTEFILAAQSIGAKPARIIFRHLLPNAITPAVVLAARDVGGFVIFQATLTFIGLGGNSIWGTILVNGRDWVIGPGGNVLAYWWVYIPATLAVILFGITWNLFGDGLGELIDPYFR